MDKSNFLKQIDQIKGNKEILEDLLKNTVKFYDSTKKEEFFFSKDFKKDEIEAILEDENCRGKDIYISDIKLTKEFLNISKDELGNLSIKEIEDGFISSNARFVEDINTIQINDNSRENIDVLKKALQTFDYETIKNDEKIEIEINFLDKDENDKFIFKVNNEKKFSRTNIGYFFEKVFKELETETTITNDIISDLKLLEIANYSENIDNIKINISNKIDEKPTIKIEKKRNEVEFKIDDVQHNLEIAKLLVLDNYGNLLYDDNLDKEKEKVRRYIEILDDKKSLNLEFHKNSFETIKEHLYDYITKNKLSENDLEIELKELFHTENLHRMEDFLHTHHKEAFGIEIKNYHIVFEDNKKEYFDNVREKAFEIIENIKGEYRELINSKEDLEKYRKENNLIEEKNNIINDIVLNWKREADRHNETKLFELPYDKDKFKDYIKEIAYDITDEKIKSLEDKYNFNLEIPELKDINYLKKEDDNKQIIFKRGAEVLELKYEKDKGKEFIEINKLVSDQRKNIYSYLGNDTSEKTFIDKNYITSELLNQIKDNFYLNLEDKENQVKPVSIEKVSIEKENLDNLDINDISYIQKLIKNKIIENLERENDKILIVDANNAIDTSINQDFLLKRTQEYNCDINTMSNIIEIEKNGIKKILPSIAINCDGYKMIDTETIREDINKLLEEKQKTNISKEKDEKKKIFEKEL